MLPVRRAIAYKECCCHYGHAAAPRQENCSIYHVRRDMRPSPGTASSDTGVAPPACVPTGTQALRLLVRRRLAYSVLVVATIVVLAGWLISILAAGGFGFIAALMLLAFLVYVPWLAIAVWNSLIGFALLNATPEPLAIVVPLLARARDDDPISARCAIAMTARNENPARALAHLRVVMASIGETPQADRFDCFVLSDSTDPEVIAAEERAIAAWQTEPAAAGRVFYRRRERNVGFKGGNVHDFCEHAGRDYEFLLLLDTDSLMTAPAILRLIRVMQANPALGILQTFAVGLPSASFFARVFQFGHRHAMRCFAVGAGWWQGDCCQFWGHNCAIRIAPYREHCRLPVLSGPAPFGGHIICHDQIEAALMRRAGYEVRFIPLETGSFEGNPPAVPDFIQRNSRWCLGNFQNLRLFAAPGLLPTSRFHLAFMAQKFFGAAAIVIFAVLAVVAAATWPQGAPFPAGSALSFYLVILLLFFSPRLICLADSALRERERYGGATWLLLGGIVEIVFTLLLTPLSMFAVTYFIVAMFSDRSVGWNGQRRDSYGISWVDALRGLWQPTLFGAALLAALALTAPAAIAWFLPFLAGLLLAVPFEVLTSSRRVGAWAARQRLCGIPEEFDPPAEVSAIWPLLMKGR
jgi:membrane glycosyltransferase